VANSNGCNDNNPCTDNDVCQSGFCLGTFNNDPCSDGNGCTQGDHCDSGFCTPGQPVNCNDNNPCSTEFCNSLTGCVFTSVADGVRCDDHNPCTTDDSCQTGMCTGAARNCQDDDPCTVDSCNSAGGAFLCQHEDCHTNGSCPAQCTPILCGNGHLDPGETCDPPDPTFDPNRPGEAKCRPDCTYCGDGVVQTNHGESCDDGNLLSGCNPSRPSVPLDACQNVCTGPICHDPSNIKMVAGRGVFTMHGRISAFPPATSVDPRTQTFVVELTDATGAVLFRSSLDAGVITAKGAAFLYVDPSATENGGISKLKILRKGIGYIVTVYAYGDLSAATAEMTTHVFIGSQEWSLAGHWAKTPHGWRLEKSGSLPPV
jgi:cysteine-rich repeat protein